MPDFNYMPILSSHRQYAFNDSEKSIIDKLREWAFEYFRQTEIYESDTRINEHVYVNSDGT